MYLNEIITVTTEAGNKQPKVYPIWDFLMPADGLTFNTTIVFIRKTLYKRLEEQNYSSALYALIRHEYVHVEQMKKLNGAHKFWIKYIFSREFRLNAELEAYKTSWMLGLNKNDILYYLYHDYYLFRSREYIAKKLEEYLELNE